jgi:LytS/YehU family sensor histidine kinase
MGWGEDWTLGYSVVNSIALLVTQLPSAYILSYIIIPDLLHKKRYFSTIAYFVVFAYFITVISRIMIVYVAEPFQMAHDIVCFECPKQETLKEICFDLYKLFRVYFYDNFSIAFLFLTLKLLVMQNEIQKKTLSLEKDKAENELKQLKEQLNPHFLFNTLNNIYALSLKNSSKTTDSIGRLSAILDYILYRGTAVSVPVQQEIELLIDYIELEKLRYDDRLIISFNTQITANIMIAPMILISLVENAFKHGAANDLGHPEIHISITSNDQYFMFEILNTTTSNIATGKLEKIGLDNISKQLDLLYGSDHILIVRKLHNQFRVKLEINL